MAVSESSTLPHLLLERSQGSSAEVTFLDISGNIVSSLSYHLLFANAQKDARRLLAAGLKGNSKHVVISAFDDHESHIRVFWACCLGEYPDSPHTCSRLYMTLF